MRFLFSSKRKISKSLRFLENDDQFSLYLAKASKIEASSGNIGRKFLSDRGYSIWIDVGQVFDIEIRHFSFEKSSGVKKVFSEVFLTLKPIHPQKVSANEVVLFNSNLSVELKARPSSAKPPTGS